MAKKQGRQANDAPVKRWGARQKERVVLHVLRGEPMDVVAREEQVTVALLTRWRDRFLDGGREQMKSRRGDPVERRLRQVNTMWGADATRFYTAEDGWCWFFGAIDHHADDIVGHHVAKIGNRFAALEPIRQGIQRYFGAIGPDVARGLSIRHDLCTQYMSNEFQGELRFLGVQASPSYVGEPECNGVIERFMRTLKEQCIYVNRFRDLEHAREEIADFIDRYNRLWLIERHGHHTPLEVREAASLPLAA